MLGGINKYMISIGRREKRDMPSTYSWSATYNQFPSRQVPYLRVCDLEVSCDDRNCDLTSCRPISSEMSYLRKLIDSRYQTSSDDPFIPINCYRGYCIIDWLRNRR